MKSIDQIKNNISNKNITVLGAGISGQGASNLANYLGANVLLSNNKKHKHLNLSSDKIKIEFSHSEKCLKSDLVIISPGINPNNSVIINKINKQRIPIVSEIEFGSWFTNSPIIAVTGSNGKSTVVRILYDIFNDNYQNVLLGGNIGVSFCMNIYKELKNNFKYSLHILELSSFQLQKIFQFKPSLACILNVTKDHLDRHGNFNNYFNDKLNIVKNYDKNSLIVYNQDDSNLKKYFSSNKNAIPFSIVNKNNLFNKSNKIYSSKTKKLIIDQNQTKLIGEHNLSNLIASIQIAKLFNIDNKSINNALINFKPLEHRMEIIKVNKNILFINDSKGTNLFSTKSALDSFKSGIILILGGYSKENITKIDIENLVDKQKIEFVICYGAVGKKLSEIIALYKKTIYKNKFSSAIKYALKIAYENNVVLLSPGFKSFDQFKNFEQRGNKFKEMIHKYYA